MISTHTLTWSVTCVVQEWSINFYISTHTLTWSVTTIINANSLKIKHFNSHAHVERDF